MDSDEITRALVSANPWWRDAAAWQEGDPQLRRATAAHFDYRPTALDRISPDGLYVLYGPRRVGKSVLVKQKIVDLIATGCEPKRIIHFSCDGLNADDLRRLQGIGRDLLTREVTEPRFWFLDEITDVPDWPAAVKWLRDQTLFREDCVVLTGSSARDLAEAGKQLAGRRGIASESDIALLPMSFRSFCALVGVALPADLPVIEPERLGDPDTADAIQSLLPWLAEIAEVWAVHLRVGGFPQAVADFTSGGEVSDEFLRSLWDVIQGEALRRSRFSPQQTVELLNRLVTCLASRVNLSRLARELSVGSHHTVADRIADLIQALIAWPCHRADENGMPLLRAQAKLYFTDPSYAALAHWRAPGAARPEASVLAEQQLGLALRRSMRGPVGFADSHEGPMYTVAGRSEIDFVSPRLERSGIEVKYTDRGLGRAAIPLRSRFGRGIVATRSTIDLDSDIWAAPASFLALLLSA